MANWKHYINNDFASCKLLAYAYDNCRKRDVRIFLIPGVADTVGISDGVDRWVAPVRADVFSVNVERLINDLQAGKEIPKPVPPVKRGRVALVSDDVAPPSTPSTPLFAERAAAFKKARVSLVEDQPKRKARVQLA